MWGVVRVSLLLFEVGNGEATHPNSVCEGGRWGVGCGQSVAIVV
jgi:hypothetical protein